MDFDGFDGEKFSIKLTKFHPVLMYLLIRYLG